jgi:hypothetical protein
LAQPTAAANGAQGRLGVSYSGGRKKMIYLARRNPSTRAEDWPRLWRSHAAYAATILTLDARLSGLFYCARVLQPTLDGAPFDPPEAARNYDGVAIVSSDTDEVPQAEMTPEVRAKIDQDELRVFSTYVPRFSFHCEEVLGYGGATGKAAVIRFLVRKAGSTREAFLAHWGGRHAEIAQLAADASGIVTRYVHDGLIKEPPPGYPFDGITETWFANTEDAARSFADETLVPVAQDLIAFCDRERSVTLLTYVIHRWPRA